MKHWIAPKIISFGSPCDLGLKIHFDVFEFLNLAAEVKKKYFLSRLNLTYVFLWAETPVLRKFIGKRVFEEPGKTSAELEKCGVPQMAQFKILETTRFVA